MDFNSVIQAGIGLMVGALIWFIQRAVKKFDDGFVKLEQRVDDGITRLDGKINVGLCNLEQRVDDGISRLDEKINTGLSNLENRIVVVEKNGSQRIDKLKDELHEFQRDMPLVYTLREDTLRFMSSIEDKISKLLYGKGGAGDE